MDDKNLSKRTRLISLKCLCVVSKIFRRNFNLFNAQDFHYCALALSSLMPNAHCELSSHFFCANKPYTRPFFEPKNCYKSKENKMKNISSEKFKSMNKSKAYALLFGRH